MRLSCLFHPTLAFISRKEISFLDCLYFSEYDIQMSVCSFNVTIYSHCFLLNPLVKNYNTRLLIETERTTCLTNCRAI